LHLFVQQHDLPSQLESHLDGERLKPEVKVVIKDSTFFLDLSLVSPLEAAYVQPASKDVFVALRSREEHSNTHYLDALREAGGAVVPFVVGSFGGYIEQASTFISTLRSALLAVLDPVSDSTAGDPVAQLHREIAAATQRRKAATVMEARKRSIIGGLMTPSFSVDPRHSA